MTVRAKFCIIGTGAGGGMLAYRLVMAGEDVLVVNTGETPDQSVFENEQSPEQRGHFEIRRDTRFPVEPEVSIVHPLIAGADCKSSTDSSNDEFHHYQIHHVNGLQNLWNGVCLRYSEDDLANKNSYNADCLWPIGYKDLDHHYTEVERLAHVVGDREDLPQFPDGSFSPPRSRRRIDQLFLERNARAMGAEISCFANRKAIDLDRASKQACTACGNCARGCRAGSVYKFSTHLLPKMRGKSNFRLLENTRVVGMVAGAAGGSAVSEVRVIDERTGSSFSIEADVVVSCAGAIETPRLLLNSFAAAPGRTAQVGLYLQDSPRVALGTTLFRLWFSGQKEDKGYGDHILLGGRLNSEWGALPYVGQLWSDYMKVPYYLADLQRVPRVFREPLARQIYKSAAVLIFFSPAVPSIDNRVTVSDRLDRYMQPQVDIRYKVSDRELAHNRGLAILARKLLRNASGYVAEAIPSPPGTGVHYVGTCRMGPGRDKGAVDKDLRFFGLDNLYICDGSVIPALSEKHPTLTIMALAHRLADHLLATHR